MRYFDFKSRNPFDKLETQVRNVKYLEVISALGNPNHSLTILDQLSVVFRTRIELSTGKVLMIPQNHIDESTSVNSEISNFHKANVTASVLNWNLLKDALSDIIAFIANLCG